MRRTPWFGDDPTFNIADWPLDPVAIDEWRGLVFVAIDPVESLTAQLGGLTAELADEPLESYTLHREERMIFDANWKIYVDNFVEGYHIPGIHPDFFQAIEFDKFETTARDGYVHMTAPPREGLFYRGVWLWMWPDWTLSLFANGFNTSRINPLAIDRTELVYHYYFADSVPLDEKERTVAGSIEVVRQDFEVCLHTNRNYASHATARVRCRRCMNRVSPTSSNASRPHVARRKRERSAQLLTTTRSFGELVERVENIFGRPLPVAMVA